MPPSKQVQQPEENKPWFSPRAWYQIKVLLALTTILLIGGASVWLSALARANREKGLQPLGALPGSTGLSEGPDPFQARNLEGLREFYDELDDGDEPDDEPDDEPGAETDDEREVQERTTPLQWPPDKNNPHIVNSVTAGNQFGPQVACLPDSSVCATAFSTDTATGLTPGADAVVSNLRDLFGNEVAPDQVAIASTATQTDPFVVLAPAQTLLPTSTGNQLTTSQFVVTLAQYLTASGTYTSNGHLVSPTGQAGQSFTLDPTSSSTNSLYQCVGTVINGMLASMCTDFRQSSGYSETSVITTQGKTFISAPTPAEQTNPAATFDSNQNLGFAAWINGNALVGRNTTVVSNQIVYGPQFAIPPFTAGTPQSNPAVAVGPSGVTVTAAQEGTSSTVTLIRNGSIIKSISLANLINPKVAVLPTGTLVVGGINSQAAQLQMFDSTTLDPLPGVAGQPHNFNYDPVNGNLIPAQDVRINPVVYPGLFNTAGSTFQVAYTGNTTTSSLPGSENDVVAGLTSDGPCSLVQQNSQNEYVIHLVPPLYEGNGNSTLTVAFDPTTAGVCGSQGSVTLSGNTTYINALMAALPCTLEAATGPVNLVVTACDNSRGATPQCSTLTLNLLAAPSTQPPSGSPSANSTPTPSAAPEPSGTAAAIGAPNTSLSSLSIIATPILAFALWVVNNYNKQQGKLRDIASHSVFANVLLGELRGVDYKIAHGGETVRVTKPGFNPYFLDLPALRSRTLGPYLADYGTEYAVFISDIMRVSSDNRQVFPTDNRSDQMRLAQYLAAEIASEYESRAEKERHQMTLDEITYIGRPPGDTLIHPIIATAVISAFQKFSSGTALQRQPTLSMIERDEAAPPPRPSKDSRRSTATATFVSKSDAASDNRSFMQLQKPNDLNAYGENGLAPEPPPPSLFARVLARVCPGSS